MGRFLRNSKGMALILTILIISLIVSLTLQFNTSMRSNLHAASNLRDGIKLGYTAKSGFNYALAVLLEDVSEGNVDSLHEAWADPKALSKNSDAQFDEGRFEVKVSDHSGRIQINKLVTNDGRNYNNEQKDFLTRFLKSFENLVIWLQKNGLLRVTTVILGGNVAAVDIGAIFGSAYTVLAGGAHPDFPGVAKLINFHHMEWACSRRLEVIDFLCGDFGWKERFHLTPRPLYLLNHSIADSSFAAIAKFDPVSIHA